MASQPSAPEPLPDVPVPAVSTAAPATPLHADHHLVHSESSTPRSSKKGGRTANSRNWQQNELQELVFARLDYEKFGSRLRAAAPSLKDPADLVHWQWEQRLKQAKIPQIRDVKPDMLDKKFREIWKAYERISGHGEDVDLGSVGKDLPMSSKKCAWQLREHLSELSRFVGKSIRLTSSTQPPVAPSAYDHSTTHIVLPPAASEDLQSSDYNSNGEPPTKRPHLMEGEEWTSVNAVIDTLIKDVRHLRDSHARIASSVSNLHTQFQSLVTIVTENFKVIQGSLPGAQEASHLHPPAEVHHQPHPDQHPHLSDQH